MRLLQFFQRWVDLPLAALTLFVPLFGLLVLYSAGYNPSYEASFLNWLPFTLHSQVFVKQGIFLTAGVVVIAAVTFIPPGFWRRLAAPLLALCLVLLLLVFEFGELVNGSRRWLALGSLRFQPSELAKLAVILVMARYIEKFPPTRELYGFAQLIVPALIVGLPMALILKQPDLGTALAIGSIGACMLLFAGVRRRVLLITVVVGLVGAVVSYHYFLKDYQKRRVRVLFNPSADPQGEGWHINQSKIAVGSGELFGKGYLQGTQTQLEFLPERTTDFIFCALAEEWGFFGSSLLLVAYLLLISRILFLAQHSRDLFGSFVCVGVASSLFFHVFVNIGMVIGLLPIVGLPLPLFSYGGSSLLSQLFSIGIVFGIHARRNVFQALSRFGAS